MRLLSRKDGNLCFIDRTDERYAILSHRWLAKQEEVSYADVLNGRLNKPGAQKIDFCLNQAKSDGYQHVWIDSCCINRDSSAELSTALNSMFRWYAGSAVCYVYLADVTFEKRSDLIRSQWFSRGWTLQELIAPTIVQFYSSDCRLLGDRSSMSEQISTVTKFGPMTASLPERFSWSLDRQTTVPEDMSYCLLGIMGVTMTPLYGIGAEEAQERLFRKIEKRYGRAIINEIRALVGSTGQDNEAHFAGQPKDDTESLLNSLNYKGMHLRWEGIENPFPETCRWLLSNPQYKLWLEGSSLDVAGSRMLWIKGKPGSGKSTIMKFAETHAEGVPKISFYFNARGSKLEQSVEGMYRSLLYQIVQRDDILAAAVLKRCLLLRAHTGRNGWSLPALKSAFMDAVKCLHQPLRCYIDALDEGDDDEVQDMVHFFEDLSTEGRIYVCFASRYHPSILIVSPELHLAEQPNHKLDLENYVTGRLRTTDAALVKQVIDKANGVFLWAVLVIKELNKVIADGSMHKAQKVLKSMPENLLNLLDTIAANGEDQVRFEVCMHWILYNEDKLGPSSFCAAVLAQLEDATAICTPIYAILRDYEVEDDYSGATARCAQWIAIWSRGLGEVVHFNVRPIHESVRDYFLKFRREPGQSWADSDRDDDPYDTIVQGCVSALHMITPSSTRFVKRVQTIRPALIRGCLGLAEGFAPSSTRTKLIEQLVAPARAGELGSSETRKLVKRPESGASYRLFGQDELVATLMGGTIGGGMYPRLLSTAAQLGLRINKDLQQGAVYQVILTTTTYVHGQDAANVLLEALSAAGMDFNVLVALPGSNHSDEESEEERDEDMLSRPLAVTLLHLAPIMSRRFVRQLMRYDLSPAVRTSNGWTPLHMAVVFHGLLSQDRDCKFHPGFRLVKPLLRACRAAHGMIVDSWSSDTIVNVVHNINSLVEYGVNVNDADEGGRTPLMLAVLLGQIELYHQLVDLGASVEATDREGISALHLLCAAGKLASADALLRRQASLEGAIHHHGPSRGLLTYRSRGAKRLDEAVAHKDEFSPSAHSIESSGASNSTKTAAKDTHEGLSA